jgi:hypothetical protein
VRRAALLAVGAIALVCGLSGVWAAAPTPAAPDASAWPVSLVDVAASAGLTTPTVYGGVDGKRFIIETNGAGVALDHADVLILRDVRRHVGVALAPDRHLVRRAVVAVVAAIIVFRTPRWGG